jgi:hypothetical protein
MAASAVSAADIGRKLSVKDPAGSIVGPSKTTDYADDADRFRAARRMLNFIRGISVIRGSFSIKRTKTAKKRMAKRYG